MKHRRNNAGEWSCIIDVLCWSHFQWHDKLMTQRLIRITLCCRQALMLPNSCESHTHHTVSAQLKKMKIAQNKSKKITHLGSVGNWENNSHHVTIHNGRRPLMHHSTQCSKKEKEPLLRLSILSAPQPSRPFRKSLVTDLILTMLPDDTADAGH